MKVPKAPGSSSGPSSAAEKDKTITRRTVKGAAGGMKGVDYEDDRRHDDGEAATIAAGTRARALIREAKAHEYQPPRPAEELEKNKAPTRDPTELLLFEEEMSAEEARKKQRRKQNIARDRFSVDKDAPELLRKKKWAEDEEESEDTPDDERESPPDLDLEPDLDLDLLGELVGTDPITAKRRAELFNPERRPEPGDPSLTDPDEIQRALGSPVAFAKHAMILGEAFRRATGASREESIGYLAKMFVANHDRAFGRLALKELGPSTGIIDVYPLEVVEHVLTRYPGFLPKVGFGRFVSNRPDTQSHLFHTDTKTPIILEYPEDLKIRGFALHGGGRPGYTFEPDVEPGKYRLHIQTPGKYSVLVSAVTKGGHTLVERLQVRVRAKTIDALDLPAETTTYPERDEAKVSAWPAPEPDPVLLDELFEAEDRRSASVMTTGERVRMQLLDALRGPQPEGREWDDDEPAPSLSATAALPDEDAEILREAVAAALEAGASFELAMPEREPTPEAERAPEPEIAGEPEPVAPPSPPERTSSPPARAASLPPASAPNVAPSRAPSLPAARAPNLSPTRASSVPPPRTSSVPSARSSSLLSPARAPSLPAAPLEPGFAPPALRFDDDDDLEELSSDEVSSVDEVTLTEHPVALAAAGAGGAVPDPAEPDLFDATHPAVVAIVPNAPHDTGDLEPSIVTAHDMAEEDAIVAIEDGTMSDETERGAVEPSPTGTSAGNLRAFTGPAAGGSPSAPHLDLAADLVLDPTPPKRG